MGLPSSALLVAVIVVGLALLAFLQIAGESLRGLQEFRLASLFSGGQAGGLVSNLIFLGLLSLAIVVGRLTLMSTLLLNLTAMAIVLPWADRPGAYGTGSSADRLGVGLARWSVEGA